MTIAGQHTLRETVNFLETKNAQILATNKGYASQKPLIDSKDPSLGNDWADFLLRWRVFFTKERTKLAMYSAVAPTIPDALMSAEPFWDEIIEELEKRPTYAALTDRFAKAGATFSAKVGQIDETDVDLEVYKKADKLTKAGESSAPWLVGAGIGTALIYFMITRKR